MSTVVVKNVPNPAFVADDIVSDSAQIASRKQMQFLPMDSLAYYKYQGSLTNTNAVDITFNLTDPESFLDPKGIFLQFNMILTTNWPFSIAINPQGQHDAAFPTLDQTVSALIRKITISSSTGMKIDEVDRYNIWANIVEMNTAPQEGSTNPLKKQSQRFRGKGFTLGDNNVQATGGAGTSLSDDSSRVINREEYISRSIEGSSTPALHYSKSYAGPTNTTNYNLNGNYAPLTAQNLGANAGAYNSATMGARTTQARVILRLDHVPFFNRFNMIPLFLFKNGLRVTISLEHPQRAFYVRSVPNNTLKLSSAPGGAQSAFNANSINTTYGNYPLVNGVNANLCFPGYDFVPAATMNKYFFPLIVDQAMCVNGAGATNAAGGGNGSPYYRQSWVVAAANTGANVNNQGLMIDYHITNPVILCDLVKPAAEIGREYLQLYQTPGGVPFKYSRIGLSSFTFPANSCTGTKQINIPISVRSLRGMCIVFQDTESDTASSILYPHLSGFMHLRLFQAQLTIGGTSFPQLPITFNGIPSFSGTNGKNPLLGVDYSTAYDQFPFLRLLMNTAGSSTITPQADLAWLDMAGTDYTATGVVAPTTRALAGTVPLEGYGDGVNENIPWRDARNFVLAFNTQRDDNSWGTGVDTTQSGTVNLYLNFTPNNATPYPNQVVVRVFYLYDSVLSVQQNGNLVRY